MRQSPPKGECTYRGSFDEVTEVEDLRSKRQLVPDYTAEGYLLLTKCAVAASSMRRYAGEGAIRFVTLDEMYAHRRAHRPLLADGPYDVKGPDMRPDMAGPDGAVAPEMATLPYASESTRILPFTAPGVLYISKASAIRLNGRVLNTSPSYLSWPVAKKCATVSHSRPGNGAE